jgi:hypothetical protein
MRRNCKVSNIRSVIFSEIIKLRLHKMNWLILIQIIGKAYKNLALVPYVSVDFEESQDEEIHKSMLKVEKIRD